jgi:ketosteroid isomerase-like protein
VTLLASSMTALLLLQEPSETTEVKELRRLEIVWNEAHLRGDADAVDKLWAADAAVVVPGMPLMTKAEALAPLRSGRLKFQRYQTSEVQVRIYDKTAVVTGRLQRAREIAGRVAEDDWRFTKVYVAAAGGWRVVAFHASAYVP